MTMDSGVARSLSGRAAVLTLLAALAVGPGCQVRTEKAGEKTADGSAATEAVPAADPVARGKYLVSASACIDCHTPFTMTAHGPEPDMTKLLSGHPAGMVLPPPPQPVGPWVWFGAATNTAFAGPWGLTYAINLTPHTTGLSAWNEEIFVKAFRTGRHMGTSRPILPPMPWKLYSVMTDEDLKAIWAYLQTIPPIDNQVPDPVIVEMTPPTADAAPPAGH